jgi:hypothetical protein
MVILRLYSFLVRRHPSQFRDRFGEEMLSIFDDSAADRKSARLLFDAGVSLFRQWFLRSPYRRSERIQNMARRANFAWTLSIIPVQIFVAAEVHPVTKTANAALFYMILPVCIFLSLYQFLNRNFWNEAGEFVSIGDLNQKAQRRLERNRDAFQIWAQRTGFILMLAMTIWICPVLIGSVFVGGSVIRSWAAVNSIVIAVQTVTYFSVLKP